MLNLANYIIQRRLDQNTETTHLTLQTLLFLTVNEMKSHNLTDVCLLNDEPFIDHRNGPIIESVYNTYQKYGAMPIDAPVTQTDSHHYTLLDPIIDELMSHSFTHLHSRVLSIRKEQIKNEYFEKYRRAINLPLDKELSAIQAQELIDTHVKGYYKGRMTTQEHKTYSVNQLIEQFVRLDLSIDDAVSKQFSNK